MRSQGKNALLGLLRSGSQYRQCNSQHNMFGNGKFKNSQQIIFPFSTRSGRWAINSTNRIASQKECKCSQGLSLSYLFPSSSSPFNVCVFQYTAFVLYSYNINIQDYNTIIKYDHHPHCEVEILLFACTFCKHQVSYCHSATSFLVCGRTTIIIVFFLDACMRTLLEFMFNGGNWSQKIEYNSLLGYWQRK